MSPISSRRWLALFASLFYSAALHGAARSSAHYALPAESVDMAGGIHSSAHSSGRSTLGVPGGEQSSLHYWTRIAPVSPLAGDANPAGPFPLLTGNSAFIAPGDSSPSLADGTDFGRRRLLAPAQVHTFTLRNPGTEPAQLATLAVTGANAVDFLAGGVTLPRTVAPGEAVEFTVTFRPFSAGLRSTTVRLTFTTPGLGPYEFGVQGLAQGELFVTNTDDAGPGSLREAVNTANALVGENMIAFAIGVTGTIELNSPLPAITESLAFEGPGPDQLTISRRLPSSPYPLLSVVPGFDGTLSLKGLQLSNGAGRAGVVALAAGHLVVEDCTFFANRVTEDLGSAALLVADGATLNATRCAFLYNDHQVDLNPVAGSAIVAWRAGAVEVSDCRFQTNVSALGAIVVDGSPTTIRRCLFESNLSPGGGALRIGPLYADQPVRVEECLFERNQSGAGAAIHHLGQHLRVVNSTFTGNRAAHEGGAIVLGKRLTHYLLLPPGSPEGGLDFPAHAELIHCTIAGNMCDYSPDTPHGRGGGLALASFADGRRSTCVLRNSVIAGNAEYNAVFGPTDLRGTVASQGWNLIGTGVEADGFVASDQVGTSANLINPRLSPLADFGGPLPTMIPLTGSPLVDAANATGLGLANDQRGYPRTLDEPARPNAAGGDGTDIGAVEFYVPPGTAPRLVGQPADLAVEGNHSADLSAIVYGSEPLTFEWRRDGVPVSGGTGATLHFDRAGPSLAGGYALVVANGFGSVTSRVAVLTVTGDFVTNFADNGPGSLRERIIAANNNPGPDTIVLTAEVPSRILLESALPAVTGPLTIIGPGADLLALERTGGGTFGALTTGAITDLSVSGLTFRHFNGPDGAIYQHYGTLTVSNCAFDANQSTGQAGVNVWEMSRITVTGCTFTGNVAGGYGGALRMAGCTAVTVADCRFADNSTAGSAGALLASAAYFEDTALRIERCLFRGNSSRAGGGAEFGGSGSGRFHQFTVRDCTFEGNSASLQAGAIQNGSPFLRLENCTLSGNTSAGHAGGVYCGDNFNGGRVTFVNCTVTANRAGTVDRGGNGGGIYAQPASGRAVLRNTLVAGNHDAGSDLVYPDVAGGFTSDGWNLIGVTNGSPDFSNAKDLLGSLAAPIEPRLSTLGDFGGPTPTHLPLAGSPAVDQGNVAGLDLAADQRGFARIVDEPGYASAAGGDGSDIGAVERATPPDSIPIIASHPADTAVKAGGPVTLTGGAHGSEPITFQWRKNGEPMPGATGWQLRLENLQPWDAGNYDLVAANAFGSATSHVAVLRVIYFRVAHGNDAGPGSLRQAVTDANAEPGGDSIYFLDDALQPISGTVQLETALPLVMGPLNMIGPGADRVTVRRTGGGTFGALTTGAITDLSVSGLTFRNFSGPDGAIYQHYGTLTVSNCAFDANQSTGQAGINVWEVSSVAVTNCTFTGNISGGYGAALRLAGATTVTVTDCRFAGNSAAGAGGALTATAGYYEDTTLRIERCTFSGNSSRAGGAADFGGSGSGRFHRFTVRDCTFEGNSASLQAGAIQNGSPFLRLENCTLSGNTSAGHAGGVYCGDNFNGGRVTFVNCTVTANRCGLADPSGQGGGIFAAHATPRGTLRNTLVAGNLDLGAHADSPDVFGTDPTSLASDGWNLIGITNGSPAFTHPADLVGSLAAPLQALLSALDDHGGPMPTHLPLRGNPAIDAGNASGLDLLADQRGLPRPVDQPGVANAGGGDGSDIGAVESSLFALPAITGQPQDVTVTKADAADVVPVTFRVIATGAESFAWFHVRNGVTNPVTGSSSATLNLPDASRANEGGYLAMVTNGSGAVASEIALLRVVLPQRIVAPEFPSSGGIRLRFQDQGGGAGDPGGFELQATSALRGAATEWEPVPAAFSIVDGSIQCDVPVDPTGLRRFYRIVAR